MIYLITYELNSDKDYTGLYDTIKSYEAWWHYIDSTWLVNTDLSAEQISDELLPHIDKDKDNLLVVKVDIAERQGWLSKGAWDWINDR
jgi:hypothetical protein